MNLLQKMYPSLTTFSDLNWEAVTEEYQRAAIDISFPEYLQLKAEEGDCPPYLFEIAYYEMAAFNVKTGAEPFPFQSGVHLNPTALFLNLEFDVPKMLEEAEKGKVEIIERPQVVCLYRGKDDEVNCMELDHEGLQILQELEDGPRSNRNFISKDYLPHYKDLIEKGLIFEI